jgi:hypothetical protein
MVVAGARGNNGGMGVVERDIRDRAAESLAELARLEVHSMFGGFGFYLDGLLVAAAWDGAFQLRHRRGSRWVYTPVDEAAVDDPAVLVALVNQRFQQLSHEPVARRRR